MLSDADADADADADELSEEETVSLFWRRIFSLEVGYLHQIAFSETGFVAMSAGWAYVNTAEPGCVPTTSLKAWQVMVLMSTPSEAERMRRPQTAGRSVLR